MTYCGSNCCENCGSFSASERCYGVAADERFFLACTCGCNGADPGIVLYKRR